jgi:hypothetical protein
MKIYKRELKAIRKIDGHYIYNYYPVDVTDYFFVGHYRLHPFTHLAIPTTFVYSWLTNEVEKIYILDPHDNKYADLCGGSNSIVLEKYWKLMYRSI